uniref:ShKT domain-containing protein n=1 Tax=Strongyloides venezuelensis TaxID=75913 RepID=A0A0K0F0G3_STRVS
MFVLSRKLIFFRYVIFWILFIPFIKCLKKTDPITKFLYSNEQICGDLFDDPGWLPAQFNCRIKCNKLEEVCMAGVNVNDKIFTCRKLTLICSKQLKSYLMANGHPLDEFKINEPQGPPITKKFNDYLLNTYKSPPALEPHPPSMAPTDQIDKSINSLSRSNQEFIVDIPSSTTPYIDQAKKYEEDVTSQVDEPFIAQNNVYDYQFVKPTPSPYYRPEVVSTIVNYPTKPTLTPPSSPIQISNEVIDNYGIPNQPSMPSINVEPQMPSINVEPQMLSVNLVPQIPSINVEPLMPSFNLQPQISSFNTQPQIPSYDTQTGAPSLNVQPEMPSINVQPQKPTINVKPQIPLLNIQQQMPSIKVDPSPLYIPSPINYNQKQEPIPFHIPTPVFTYNLHNQDNQPPSFGPIQQSSLYSKITNYKTKQRPQHVPTSLSKYGYYNDGYSYKKNTWKQANKKFKKKVLYSDSGFFNGLRDLSKKCCTWALNGMCDGYWQRIRLICPKSCGTVVCSTEDGKTGCNRAIDVNVYDCERQNEYYLGVQSDTLNGELSRPLYNHLNNYESTSMGYQRNAYDNENINLYSGNAYSIENEMIGWKKVFRAKRA